MQWSRSGSWSIEDYQRLRNVVLFIAATAIGATVSSVLGAFGSTHAVGSAEYWRELQLWWGGNWLGSLTVAPVMMGWIRYRTREYAFNVAASVGNDVDRLPDPGP